MYYHREDREQFIAYLAEKFPKCFFTDPHQRRPLKHNIAVDLERERVLDADKISQTLDWYQNHYSYRYSLVAGVQRIDLDGDKAGTVTPQEQADALAWVAARKREIAERNKQQTLIVVTKANGVNGRVAPSNGAMIAAPTDGVASAEPTSMTELRAAVKIINCILTEEEYAALRPVLATVALRELAAAAGRLIGSLTNT